MGRKNHKTTRRIVVSPRVVEAARLVAQGDSDEREVAARVIGSRRISRRMWNQLTKLA